ncbi:MAG: hypothetical protein GY928_01980 [Colwellia sp.]|nr:hypothetical protein [Colwellia sp.]
MAIILNQQGDCASDTLGTGLAACVALYGDINGIDLWSPSYTLDTTTESLPTESEYKELVQAKTVYPLNEMYDFDQTTPDNEVATSSRGVKKEIRTGKPEFSFIWSNGACFHQGVFDKVGQGRWAISMKFETGVLFTRNVAGTILKPFDNGMFSVNTYKFQQGTDPDLTTALVQFPSAVEFNSRQVFFTWDELTYDMNSVSGVLNAKLLYTTDPTAATTFSVSVTSLCNESVIITGLEDTNDWVLGGTQASPTTISTVTYNAGTDSYDFVLDTALISTDTVQPSLADVSGGYDVAENASGDLYQGTAALFTVV